MSRGEGTRWLRFHRTIRLSIRALFAHRLRAILAMSSVSAGVAAVVLTSGLGAGAARAVRGNIESLGTNLLVVRPAQVRKLVARKQVAGLATTLRIEDCDAIEQLVIAAKVAPGIESNLRVKGESASTVTKVLGTTTAFPAVRNFRIRSGRFFDDEDNRASRRVAVLGAGVAKALFPDEDAIGSQIRIRGATFEVIGVLAPKGVLADGDEDNQVVVPIRTALRRVFNSNALTTIFVSVENGRSMDGAEREVAAVLHERHAADDFEIQNAARMFAMQQKTAQWFSFLTTGLSGLALLVGGAGILALMLMTVRERTTEIGLRVAVGARPRDILLQFLLEAAFLAVSGWAAGLLAGGIAIGVVIASTSWSVRASVGAIVSSLGVALTIGFGFGALPARKASLVPPIEALRAE